MNDVDSAAPAHLDVLNGLSSQQALERSRLTERRELVERRIELHRSIAGGLAPGGAESAS